MKTRNRIDEAFDRSICSIRNLERAVVSDEFTGKMSLMKELYEVEIKLMALRDAVTYDAEIDDILMDPEPGDD